MIAYARIRIGNNLCRSRIRFCSHLSVTQTTVVPVNDKLDEILSSWPGAYRSDLNNIMRSLSLDEEYVAAAKAR